jgi:hypothetical protein
VTLALGPAMTSPTIAILAPMTVQSCPKIGTGTDEYSRFLTEPSPRHSG